MAIKGVLSTSFSWAGVWSASTIALAFPEPQTVGGNPDLVNPVCFDEVPEGEYNLSMGIPDGYNPTTSMNYSIEVTAGDVIVVDFGAQPSTQMAELEVPVSQERSPLLLVMGLFLLAGGAGLAYFFLRAKMKA